ncbi:MFS transporter, partial [Georgenia sp. 10Sc9-8]|nr:MFS transporter [Georgenia halotolerans]
ITPAMKRARVLATLGGMHRLGAFVGPFLGAAAIAGASLRAAYWVAAGCALLAVLVLLAVREPEDLRAQPRTGRSAPGREIRVVVRRYRHLFLTLGTAVFLVGATRGARQTVIPLWGEYQGFDPEVISLIFGLSGALDVLLFYPAGKVMDAFGRLWIGIPSMAIMAGAMVALPLTSTVAGVTVVAAVLGLGNGMGSGIMMTLGSDVAPPAERSTFLGVWRLFQDSGDAAGPLAISAGAALGSLAAGIWVTATFGTGAAAALARWVPRYSEHASRTTRRRAGLL